METALLAVTLLIVPTGSGLEADEKAKPKGSAESKDRILQSELVQREEVRFVTLDIVVEERAREGWRPAKELSRDQVKVLVGGQEMALDLFENWCGHEEDRADDSVAKFAGSETSRDLAAGTSSSTGESNRMAAAVPTSRYVLYFDLDLITFGGRNRTFRSALEWADKASKPSDEVMILTGGRSLRIVRPMLPASRHLKEDIQAAMEDFSHEDMWGEGEWRRVEEIRRLLRVSPGAAEALANSYAAIDRDVTRRSLENLRDVMAIFERIEGTKNMLFFSENLRLVPGSEYPATRPTFLTDVYPSLQDLAQEANERNVRIYTIQAAGLEEDKEIEDPMTMLAEATGGRHVENTNRMGFLFDRAAEDLACFYRIGFRFPSQHSGQSKQIDVRIAGGGKAYRTRYRRTLEDPTRSQKTVAEIRAALLEPASAKSFPVTVTATPLIRHSGGSRIRIQISAPLDRFLALAGPEPGSRRVSIQVGGQVVPLRDRRPASSPSESRDVWADVDAKKKTWGFGRQAVLHVPPAAQHDPRTVVVVEEIDVPAGSYRVVGVIGDQQAEAVASAVVDFQAGGSLSSGLGEIGLGVEDARIVVIETAGQNQSPAGVRRSRKEITQATPLLSPRIVPIVDATLEEGSGALLFYDVCSETQTGKPAGRSPGKGSFAGWSLSRQITCGSSNRTLPPRSVPSPADEDPCVLLVDPVSPGLLAPAGCTFEVTLSRQGFPPQTRALKLHVIPAARAEAAPSD